MDAVIFSRSEFHLPGFNRYISKDQLGEIESFGFQICTEGYLIYLMRGENVRLAIID
ncbi:MAG: hypothetical protein IPJ66_17220 [Bacteroidetes bacterium]|nr:hypothetical protein [Bacteroidota bacterium]